MPIMKDVVINKHTGHEIECRLTIIKQLSQIIMFWLKIVAYMFKRYILILFYFCEQDILETHRRYSTT